MIKAVKYHSLASLVMLSFAAFIIGTSVNGKKISDAEPLSISDSSIRADIFHSFDINMKEIHGIKIEYFRPYRVAYYFEYEGDYQTILDKIAALPFQLDNNPSSIKCGLMEGKANPLQDYKTLPETALEASQFFWNQQKENYTFYECFKSPMRHTLLVSKTSNKILHRIETI